MALKSWIKLNIGLLDDDRFEAMTNEQVGAWIKAYLIIAKTGSVKSLDRLRALLQKQGVEDPSHVTALYEMGWLVSHSGGGITIRGFEQYQADWKKPPLRT